VTSPKLEFDNKITLGTLIQIVLLIVTLAGGWYTFQYRIVLVEKTQAENVQALQSMKDAADKQGKFLDKLTDELIAFPLHRHIDHELVYPDGKQEPMPR
jgi:hypothetical protein